MRPLQRISLEVVDEQPPMRYPSRIEGVFGDYLTLAAPLRQGVPVPLHDGTSLRVTLFHAGGAHGFETQVIGREPGRVPLLRVSRPRRMEAIQRRQYFREPAVVRTLCGNSGEDGHEITGVTRNLGGGGLCIRTKDLRALHRLLAERNRDDPLWVEIGLPDRPLRAVVNLAWCQIDDHETSADLAFEFLDLPNAERERLIKYLFSLQRAALRKGL
ncbi:MAG: flagellar brake domain-containing protein [Fimbriimonadaceae bacterium]|nr:flagellar brake domain-containing protein [Fimbriimonadaceae bacterium]